jgi:hypothetical protein
MEQFGAFGGLIRAKNGPSSDGSERFYMSYGPCSGGVPSAAPSPVLVALASRKSSLPRMHIWHICMLPGHIFVSGSW